MNITNFSNIPSSQSIQGLQRPSMEQGGVEMIRQTASQRETLQRDSVSFSEEALRLSDTVKTNSDSSKIRFDLVNRIKAEISAGTYDTPEKMDIALERMTSRIF